MSDNGLADEIMVRIDRECQELSLNEYATVLNALRSQIQSRIDAAREDQRRESERRAKR
jgi:hypothetical protein